MIFPAPRISEFHYAYQNKHFVVGEWMVAVVSLAEEIVLLYRMWVKEREVKACGPKGLRPKLWFYSIFV